MKFCVGEQRDSWAAERQHCQGAVHRGKIPFPRPRSGPRVLWPRDQRGVYTLWRHTSAMQQTTFPVSLYFEIFFLCIYVTHLDEIFLPNYSEQMWNL